MLMILALPALAFAVVSCAEIERPVPVPTLRNVSVKLRPVRVLVGTGTRAAPLEISARREVYVLAADGRTLLDKMELHAARASSSGGAVTLAGKTWKTPAVMLAPSPDDYVAVGKNSYAGGVALVTKGEDLIAVNYVPMEHYIAGVVSHEMPSTFVNAALEAQAVAARTYALWTMKDTGLQPYDLYSTERSQMYGGVTRTNAAGRRAAERTAGVVLVYGDDWQFLPAFYYSTCGGYTASAEQMRGAPVIGPLTAVECDYCKASKRYRWRIVVPAREMEEMLAKVGYVAGRLEDIKVTKTALGGWVDTVDIVSSEGTRALTGYAFRQVVGTSKLYSTNFTVTASADGFVIDGRGFGHGVGMCQFGADGMGRRGMNYVRILQHYYTGARVVKIY